MRSARQKLITREKYLDRVQARTLQPRVQKDARSKVQPPVAETSVEISRSKRRPYSQTVKTCRTEIPPLNCRRPTNTESRAANDLRTNCVPCRRRQVAPTIHNHHSKKRVDYARAGSGRRGRQAIRLRARQEFPYAWSANRPFKAENAQRSTPNVQRPTQKQHRSFGVPLNRPDAGHKNSN